MVAYQTGLYVLAFVISVAYPLVGLRYIYCCFDFAFNVLFFIYLDKIYYHILMYINTYVGVCIV